MSDGFLCIVDMCDPPVSPQYYAPIVFRHCGGWDRVVTLPTGVHEYTLAGQVVARVEFAAPTQDT